MNLKRVNILIAVNKVTKSEKKNKDLLKRFPAWVFEQK